MVIRGIVLLAPLKIKSLTIGPVDFDYVFSHLLNDYKKHPVGNSIETK
jgi:hypothetical protein